MPRPVIPRTCNGSIGLTVHSVRSAKPDFSQPRCGQAHHHVPFQSPFQARLKPRVGLFLDFESKNRGDQSCGEPELSEDLKDAANRKRKLRCDGTSGAAYRPQPGDILTVRI
jgi:hypothetical protein